MKSIYSTKVLQRILDHWGVGRVEDVTYSTSLGRNIWRHHISTNQGEFELCSYPDSERKYAEPKLQAYLDKSYGKNRYYMQKQDVVHSFDRYHVLLQLVEKYQISAKQASKDFALLFGLTIQKAFRVYGTILQIHLEEAGVGPAGVLVSYGQWSITDHQEDREAVNVESWIHTSGLLDIAVELVERDAPTIEQYSFEGEWVLLHLSNGLCLHFKRSEKFPALEIHLNAKRNNVIIFEEKELYYTRECHGF